MARSDQPVLKVRQDLRGRMARTASMARQALSDRRGPWGTQARLDRWDQKGRLDLRVFRVRQVPRVRMVSLDLQVRQVPPDQLEVMVHPDLQGLPVPTVRPVSLERQVQRDLWDQQVQTEHKALPDQREQRAPQARPVRRGQMAQQVQLVPRVRRGQRVPQVLTALRDQTVSVFRSAARPVRSSPRSTPPTTIRSG